jgi:hypothetical protein
VNIQDIQILFSKEVQVSAKWKTPELPPGTYTDSKTIFMLSMEVLDSSVIPLKQRLCIISLTPDQSGQIVQVDSVIGTKCANIFKYYFSLIHPSKGWHDFKLVNPADTISTNKKFWTRPVSNKRSVYIGK